MDNSTNGRSRPNQVRVYVCMSACVRVCMSVYECVCVRLRERERERERERAREYKSF